MLTVLNVLAVLNVLTVLLGIAKGAFVMRIGARSLIHQRHTLMPREARPDTLGSSLPPMLKRVNLQHSR